MKYYTLSFILIIFLSIGCQKEINNGSPYNSSSSNSSSVSEKVSPGLSDSIYNCNWVFTEYHDNTKYQIQTDSASFVYKNYIMVIISSGNETAKIDNNGKLYLNREYDFSFANSNYFNITFPSQSFVSYSYTTPFYDTVNCSIVNKSIILSKSVKYLPDTMSIKVLDTACLVLSGILHTKDYDVNRTIVFYKNTRWYGGYRNYSGF
jgi:hypothetical protein